MTTEFYPPTITGKDDRAYVLRPIRPSDAPSLMRGYDAMTDNSKWFRMLHALPHLTDEMARNYCDPDPAHEVCLVVEGKDALGGARVAGLVPGGLAEYSVSFRPEARGLGLGRKSLQAVIDIARQRACRGVIGYVAARNDQMRGLASRLGMRERRDPDDFSLVMTELDLSAKPASAA